MKESTKERNIISDKFVFEKTGRPIQDWFLIIDKKGGQSLTQKEVYNIIAGIEGLESLGEWNQNLLTTTYLWDRGLRLRGQKPDGYEISVSKTVNVDISLLYNAFIDDKLRDQWLGIENITIRKATSNKSARVTWSDSKTSISIDFYSKGVNKSQIVVQHQKIEVYEMSLVLKAFWGDRLERFKKVLEV